MATAPPRVSELEPISSVLMALIHRAGSPRPGPRRLELMLHPTRTPIVTMEAVCAGDGYVDRVRRLVESGDLQRALAGDTETTTTTTWQARIAPVLLKLEADAALLLTHLYILRPHSFVFVFQCASSECFPGCLYSHEQVAFVLVAQMRAPLPTTAALCLQIVRETAVAGTLPAWDAPAKTSARLVALDRFGWTNASAYTEAQPTAALSWLEFFRGPPTTTVVQ